MKSSVKTLLCLALAAGLVATMAPSALAQVTTGSISGTVSDSSGGRLPGVTVNATHQPTGTNYGVTTGADGRFALKAVRVGGPYSVKAELEGFKAEEKTDVYVGLGQDSRVEFALELGAVAETVTVVGQVDTLINPNRTGAASNISTAEIENLPTIGRGLEDFTRTNPFVTITAENNDPNSISIAGRNSRYNNIQIDGAVNNDLFGLADQGTPGGQAQTTPISLDAIQEIQVVVADFDVRQGGFSGGSVNAITRSGSNNFKGSVFYFTRDEGLVGDGPDELGDFGTFDEDNYGFRVGGPIRRDKLFFFVNGETVDKSEPTGVSIDGSAGTAFANGEAIDEANAFRNALMSRYGFDPGGLGQQNRDTPSDKLFGRLDFNLADNHQLTVRHNYIDATNDVNFPSSTAFEWTSETYQFTNETNSTVAQLNSVLGSNMFNELRLTYQKIKDRRAGVVTFPWIEIEDVLGDGSRLEFEAGTEPFSTRNALDQDILEITDDFTWIKGDHTLTFGTHNELFTFDNLFIQNAFGAYQFRTLSDFLNNRPARQFDYTVVPPGQAESQKFDVTQIGLYAGDQWAARPNLTLLFGLRVDVPYFPDTPTRNQFTEATYGFRTDEIPDGKQLWQPRFGFNWDVAGDGKSQLRGGLGIFAGRTPYVWISNTYARTGIEQQFIQALGVPFNPDPFNQPTSFPGVTPSIGEFNLIDPDFEFPQVLRYNLAYDRELPWWGLIGSIEAIYADSVKEIDYADVNLRRTGATAFTGQPIYTRVDSGVTGAFLIRNSSDGDATNIAVKVEKPYRDGLSGFVSYAWGDATVINDGTSSRAVSNWQFTEAIDPNNVGTSTSDFEVEHRFNASVNYTVNRDSRFPTTLGLFYNLQSGRPYSSLLGSSFPSLNGDRATSNDLFYVPSGPDDVVITNGTWAQLDAYIRSDSCLDSHRGSVAPRNCSNSPWWESVDLHVAQAIPIKSTSLELTFDIQNLMNLFDSDAGRYRFVNFGTATVAFFEGIDAATGKPRYSLQRIVTAPDANPRFTTHNIVSRWRAKLGLRWTF